MPAERFLQVPVRSNLSGPEGRGGWRNPLRFHAVPPTCAMLIETLLKSFKERRGADKSSARRKDSGTMQRRRRFQVIFRTNPPLQNKPSSTTQTNHTTAEGGTTAAHRL